MKLMTLEDKGNMYLLADEQKHKIHSILEAGEDYQIVVDYYPSIQVGGILVLIHKNGDEVLGIINEVEDNELHRILYVEINPNQIKNLNVKQLKNLMLWGSL